MEAEPSSTQPNAGGGINYGVEASTSVKQVVLSPTDLDLLRGLDDEYINAVNEKEVEIKARMMWAFRSAVTSIFVMVVYLVGGVIFLSTQTDWRLLDTMLFAMYTLTSAGYGHVYIPQTAAVQTFLTFYIMFGIANLAIVVAQVYQYALLRASRLMAQAAHEKDLQARKHREHFASEDSTTGSTKLGKTATITRRSSAYLLLERVFQRLSKLKAFFNDTDAGQVLSVVLPLLAIHLSGSLIIGAIEGWNFIESAYYGVVTMATVGYGDYFPTTNAGIIVCLFWLPWNIVFMSIYMTGVAKAYFALARKSISQIEKNLKRNPSAEHEFDHPLSTEQDGSTTKVIDLEVGDKCVGPLDKGSISSSSGSSENGVEENETAEEVGDGVSQASEGSEDNRSIQAANKTIFEQVPLSENQYIGFSPGDTGALETMTDVIAAVHAYSNGTLKSTRNDGTGRALSSRQLEVLFLPTSSSSQQASDESTSVTARRSGKETPLRLRKPCFVTRVLVKERLARIIASELVGSQFTVDLQDDNSISIRPGKMKEISAKWSIPRAVRQSFRAVAFEALLYVGETNLLRQGAQALLELRPDELHRIFSPLLAQMGDADAFEAWLANTEHLAERELKSILPCTEEDLQQLQQRKLVIVDNLGKLPTNIGNAFQK